MLSTLVVVFSVVLVARSSTFYDKAAGRGLADPDVGNADEYPKVGDDFETPSGSVKFKTQQMYEGLLVFGDTMVVEANADGSDRKPRYGKYVDAGELAKDIPYIIPELTEAEAGDIALAEFGQTADSIVDGSLSVVQGIFTVDDGPNVNAYDVGYQYDIGGGARYTAEVWLNANTGTILRSYANELAQTKSEMCGIGGLELYPVNVFCNASALPVTPFDVNGASRYLMDDDMIIFDAAGGTLFTNQETCTYTAATDQCDVDDAPMNGAYGISSTAYYAGVKTFEMWRSWSYSGRAPRPDQYYIAVNYGVNYENAWNSGQQVACGNGDYYFYPLCSYKDVMAHEMAHGFTGYYSGLIYDDQSGGMNEAFSDLSGASLLAFIDGSTPWMVGFPLKSDNSLALRVMYDPPASAFGSLDHFDDYDDSVGVHTSSGIFNKMFYLMSEDNPDGTQSMTVEMVFKVVERANGDYWTSDSTFQEGVCGIAEALEDIYGEAANYLSMVQDLSDAAETVGLSGCAGGVTPSPTQNTMMSRSFVIDGAADGEYVRFSYRATRRSTAIGITLEGDNGDADLYLKWDTEPTGADYECASYSASSNEYCELEKPDAPFPRPHVLHVAVYGWSAFTDLTFTWSMYGDAQAFLAEEVGSSLLDGPPGSEVHAEVGEEKPMSHADIVGLPTESLVTVEIVAQILAFLSLALSGLVYVCKTCEVCCFAPGRQGKYAAVAQVASSTDHGGRVSSV